jgi:hypothetical protein
MKTNNELAVAEEWLLPTGHEISWTSKSLAYVSESCPLHSVFCRLKICLEFLRLHCPRWVNIVSDRVVQIMHQYSE